MAAEVAARLGVDASELTARAFARPTTCEELGYLTCEAGEASRRTELRTEVVVHEPTGIQVLNRELLGDTELFTYRVERIGALSSYAAPAGATAAAGTAAAGG